MPVKSRKTRSRKKANLEFVLTQIPRDDIEKLAYEIWESRGRLPGDGIEYWLEAEEILRKKYSIN